MAADVTNRFLDHLEAQRPVMREAAVREAIELHLLDTLAAVISGRVMPAGEAAGRWLATRGTPGRSSAAGSGEGHHAEEAAFVNAMCAHADESDDSHEPSRSHPGAAVVPTALAVGEALDADGDAVLEAIGLGYEACALMNWLMWSEGSQRRRAAASPHALGGFWGSVVAAGTLHGFDRRRLRWLVSYSGQLSSGVGSWLRDEYHIEKAFAFSGMGAWNAVRAAELVAADWPGVNDPLDGDQNVFRAFGAEPDLAAFEHASSSLPVVVETNIKKYCVGSPAQAAVQGAEELHHRGIRAADVRAVRVVLPEDLAYIVNKRDMTNINVQYLVARTLVEGTCTFAAAHDEDGADLPDVAQLLGRTELVGDNSMEPIRQARVEADVADGSTETRSVFPVRGTKDDPMSRAEVESKADDLMAMALDAVERQELIAACREMDRDGLKTVSEALRRTRDLGVYAAINQG